MYINVYFYVFTLKTQRKTYRPQHDTHAHRRITESDLSYSIERDTYFPPEGECRHNIRSTASVVRNDSARKQLSVNATEVTNEHLFMTKFFVEHM